MTRTEAIKILEGAIKKPNTKDGYMGQALSMAINSLKVDEMYDLEAEQADEFIPKSVIDDIKSEILHYSDAHCSGDDINLWTVFEIMDKHTSGKE